MLLVGEVIEQLCMAGRRVDVEEDNGGDIMLMPLSREVDGWLSVEGRRRCSTSKRFPQNWSGPLVVKIGTGICKVVGDVS